MRILVCPELSGKFWLVLFDDVSEHGFQVDVVQTFEQPFPVCPTLQRPFGVRPDTREVSIPLSLADLSQVSLEQDPAIADRTQGFDLEVHLCRLLLNQVVDQPLLFGCGLEPVVNRHSGLLRNHAGLRLLPDMPTRGFQCWTQHSSRPWLR